MITLNAPNAVTLFRLLLIVPFIVLLSYDEVSYAMMLFILISLLDGVDGFIARHTRQQSRFGEIFDGVSDIIILIAAFIALITYGHIPLFWHVYLITMTILLILAKLVHMRLTGETRHTIPGKITAFLAYTTVMASLITSPQLSFIIGAFVASSLYTSGYFLMNSFRKS